MNYTAQYEGFTLEIKEVQKESEEICFEGTSIFFDSPLIKEYTYQGFWKLIGKFKFEVDNYLANVKEQEDKPMNFPYKGYTLEIESKEEDGATRLIGRCTKTGWMLSTLGDYIYLIDRYKKDIEGHIQATQKQKEIEELKQKEAREIPDLLKSIDEKLEKLLQIQTTGKVEPCIFVVQKILKNTPESADELFQLLLDFKFKTEEGIGEKE